MRLHHLIAIAVVLVIGIGVKWFFFSTSTAEAQRIAPSTTIDVLQMHHPNLPEQKMHDMTFVFSDEK